MFTTTADRRHLAAVAPCMFAPGHVGTCLPGVPQAAILCQLPGLEDTAELPTLSDELMAELDDTRVMPRVLVPAVPGTCPCCGGSDTGRLVDLCEPCFEAHAAGRSGRCCRPARRRAILREYLSGSVRDLVLYSVAGLPGALVLFAAVVSA